MLRMLSNMCRIEKVKKPWLSAWQDNEAYPKIDNSVRLNLEGYEIAYLFPEGRKGSRCWVWIIYDNDCSKQIESGSDLDREMARKQVDKKLEELGYQLR